MKKLAVLIVFIIALLSLSVAFSEAAGKPILFRDIEWGASYESIAAGGEMDKLFDGTGGTGFVTTLDERHFTAHLDGDHPDYNEYVAWSKYNHEAVGAIGDIAGYNLIGISMFFVYVPDEDGHFVKDGAHARLYCAGYELGSVINNEISDLVDKEKDIVAKLSSLYGEYEVEKAGKYDCYLWRGADGTSVAFARGKNIVYSYEGGDTLLKQAQDAMDAINAEKEAQKKEFSQKTNGL